MNVHAVSPRVPSSDYREMLEALQSHKRELVRFAQDPQIRLGKAEREIAALELVLAAERARLDAMRKAHADIDATIAAVDERIAEVRVQVMIREKMEKWEKAKQMARDLARLQKQIADNGAMTVEDDIVS